MFESLSNKLENAFHTLKGHGKITEINIAQTIKEIRRALVDADVNYKVAKTVTDNIKTEALGQDVISSLTPGQLLTKIVSDELTELMGGETQEINLKGSPATILISGLQGSGKTTFTGKLSHFLKSKGKNVLVVACDVYRPAAIEQLKVLAEQVGVDVYTEENNKNPVDIAKNAVAHAKSINKNVVIIDTAGRLAVDEEMMQEIENIKKAIDPSETLFVVDSMTGQDAVNTAKTFNDRIDFDGTVLTKLDGDARGGAALSIRTIVEKPIKFVSTGEKIDTLDIFHPDRMAQRILGMGDVVSLVEKAQQVFDEEESRRLNKKIRKNQFNYEDFLTQIQQIKKMGSMKDIVGMLPGMGKALKDQEIDEDAFKPIEAIIHSMTPYERQNPDSINASRKARLAKGSGTDMKQVNGLIKQFKDMRKMMKMMNKMSKSKGGMANLKNMFGG